jgi:hypothetical protein
VKKSVALHGLADERLESRIAKRVAALSPQHEVALGRSPDDCRLLALRASGDPETAGSADAGVARRSAAKFVTISLSTFGIATRL